MLSRIATAARPLVRQMSGDAAQAAKDATLWKYIGFAATAGSLTFAGVKVSPRLPPSSPCYPVTSSLRQVSGHLSHDHHIEDPIKYPFLRKRDKAFPWACQDCTLFDGACKVSSPTVFISVCFLVS